MAKRKPANYFWWSPEKWADIVHLSGNTDLNPGKVRYHMKNMTHHERRLYIRKLLKEKFIAYQAFNCEYVSPNSPL